jgi:hypothetical protein
MMYRAAQTTVKSPRNVTIFIPYGARDSYDTTFERGCFTQSLTTKLPPVLWSHRPDEVVGKVTDFRERADGLELDIRLADPDRVPSAGKVSSLLADDMVPGISFGFRDALSNPHPFLRGVRQFVKAVMDEVSFVAKPSIPGTRVLSLRHAGRGGSLDVDVALALARMKLNRIRT